MKKMTVITDLTSCRKALEEAKAQKIALIYHLKIAEQAGYRQWLAESLGRFGCRRLFHVTVDPVPREGMLIDEIVIDEFPSVREAFDFLSNFKDTLQQVCSEHAFLAVMPEPAITFHLVKAVSWLVRLFKGVRDEGIPSATWKADNTAVWPDTDQMKAARDQDIDKPLFVYNLNKYKPVADYKGAGDTGKEVSGKEAYDRYSKIAGFELLRRGAYPVYGGKPICLLGNHEGCMLADNWDHFIFVRYPQRRNLLAMIESDEFHQGEVHRDAGLERVAIFMAKQAE